MTIVARNAQLPTLLQNALAWLDSPPADDPLRELGPLLRHLREAAEAARAPAQRLKVLGLFQARSARLTTQLRPQLLDASLPLTQRLRTIAQGLIDAHGMLAALTLRVVADLGPTRPASLRDALPSLCTGILQDLAEQQRIALMVAGPPPTNLWSQVQVVHHLMAGLDGDLTRASQLLRSMLALAAAQPETFSAHEVAFLADYLDGFAAAVEISTRPTGPLETWYWLEESRDLPPVAAARRLPPQGRTVTYFSCAALGQVARLHAAALGSGVCPPGLRPPAAGAIEDYAATLAAAEARWSAPPRRRVHRRHAHFRVEICTPINGLWHRLAGTGTAESSQGGGISQWMVLNESPGGFGLMHVSGSIAGLRAGDALGMRFAPDDAWKVCLVRWARSDNPEHVEIGLELVAPSSVPVNVVDRLGGGAREPTPALLLPPLPALHRGETLLVARGHYGRSPFTLLREVEGKLQVSECLAERIAVQTAGIELFEFTRDFSVR